MHEASIARQLVTAAIAQGHKNGARKITRIAGWVAETETLSKESITMQAAAQAVGSIAEGAAIDLDVFHVEARCSTCGEVYRPEHHLLLCPKCGGTDAALLREVGIGVQAIDVE
ncbi:MAG: hydrogenase maturation nickel metallochaperone HypA [Byssovorax sp.]